MDGIVMINKRKRVKETQSTMDDHFSIDYRYLQIHN
jgi:hypothetical protein